MLQRLAAKLHNRRGVPGDEGPVGRALARARQSLGRLERSARMLDRLIGCFQALHLDAR